MVSCNSKLHRRGVLSYISGTCSFQTCESRRGSAVWTLGPPLGGPCQPTMCERGTSNNGFLTEGGISSQPVYKHSPPDGGPNHQSSTSVKRCACHASHF